MSYQLSTVPSLGQTITMDFINISLSKEEILSKVLDLLKENNFQLSETKNFEVKNKESLTLHIFIEEGYISVTHFTNNSLTLEGRLLNTSDKSEVDIVNLEVAFGNLFGWNNLIGDVFYKRGGVHYHMLNKYYHSETLYKNFELIHREQTKFQDLRIYNTKEMGRVLSLDYMPQNSDAITEDNYTIDLCNLVLAKNTEYDNVLLIGAGDMIFPEYMLRTFKIKKITLVEIDDRVIENTKKYFKFYETIEKHIQDGKLEVIVDDGAKYLREKLSFGEQFDGVIIDNSDVFLFEGPASNLFTKEFYANIRTVLKKGGLFSQQVSDDQVKEKWVSMVKSVGFEHLQFKESLTPEYSTKLPLAAALKN